jgi:hypothetical protein
MMRKLAVLATIQYLAGDLDEMEITIETIYMIYDLERYSQERVVEMKSILKELFSCCDVLYATGRMGMEGFDGFKLKWRPTKRRGKKRKSALLEIIEPEGRPYLNTANILEYNLMLAQSVNSPWKRGR